MKWLYSQDWVGLLIAAFVALSGAGVILLGKSTGPDIVSATLMAVGLCFVALSAFLAAGTLFHLFMLARYLRKYPPPGRLIDVGGYRMHILAEGTGGPAVVWIPGSNDQGIGFIHLHNQIKTETRSILYDRIASGWSDVGPFPRTLEREVEELYRLLTRAGEKGPFIFAAHSRGGLIAQNFAVLNPNDTAGLVLIDSAGPDAATYTKHLKNNVIPGADLKRWLASVFGIIWIIAKKMQRNKADWLAPYDTAVQDQIILGLARPKLAISFMSALQSMFGDPFSMVKGDGALGDIPLIALVPPTSWDDQLTRIRALLPDLTDHQAKNFVRLGFEVQMQTARLSSRGLLQYAPPGTTHGIPFEVPDFVCDQVREMIAMVRSGSPVPGRATVGLADGRSRD